MNLAAAVSWVQGHWITVGLVVLGVVANVMPRPAHQEMTGWKATFWKVVDLLCFMTAQTVPGRWKMFFTVSPVPPAAPSPLAAIPPPPGDVKIDEKE